MNRDNKTIYYKVRQNKGLTREQACAKLDQSISVDRLERIENGRANPTPFDVKELAKAYGEHSLCNHYCVHECEIGKDYIPEVKIKDLSQITLETLSSLNQMEQKKNRLIEITVDGKITKDELKDFILIKHELDKISMTIDSLRLWTEQMKSSGMIDEEEYENLEKKLIV